MCELFVLIARYFAENLADWALVVFTALSIAASTAVAVLAYMNGRKANAIANAAAERDQWHRDNEALLRMEAERKEVALAMLRAINAIEAYRLRDSITYADGLSQVEARNVHLVSEATALIDVYSAATEESGLRQWFTNVVSETDPSSYLEGEESRTRVDRTLKAARSGIVEWASRRITVCELPPAF